MPEPLAIDPATGEVTGVELAAEPPPPPKGSGVPQEPWERLYESALLGLRRPDLRERLGAEVMALLSPENLWVLAVCLAAWVAATLLSGPVGWLLNTGLLAAGVVALAADVIKIAGSARRWAIVAYQAQSRADLDRAGGHFADALVEAGGTTLSVAFTTTAFRAAKAAVLRFRTPPAPRQEPRAEERTRPREEPRAPREEPRGREEPRAPREEPREPRPPREEPRGRAREVLTDAARVRGAQAVVDHAGVLLAVGGGLGVAVLLTLAVLALARRRRRGRGVRDA